MTGHWTYRDADFHRCARPTSTYHVRKYDRWQCDLCHTEWIVTSIGGDQRDRYLVWEEYEKWKSGPFAPGTK